MKTKNLIQKTLVGLALPTARHCFRRFTMLAGIALMLGIQAKADVLIGYEIAGANSTITSPLPPDTTAANLTGGSLTLGSGVAAASANNTFGANNWDQKTTEADAITGNDYVTFTVAANSSYSVSFTTISAYNIRRSATGPSTGIWQYSTDGVNFTDIGSAITWGGVTTSTGNPQAAIDLSGISALQNVAAGTTVTFRIVNWGGTGATGTWYINQFQTGDDLLVQGTVGASTSVPTVTVSAATGVSASEVILNGNVTSDGSSTVLERGFCYKASSGVAITDNQTAVAGTTGAYTLDISSLDANVQYFYVGYATNAIGLTLSAETNFWTLANTPAAPLVGSPTASTLTVGIGSGDGNSVGTLYAIHVQSPNRYVQADGTLNTTPVWQPATIWSSQVVSGLSANTAYNFELMAQNGAGTNTIFGPSTLGTTANGTTPPAVATQAATGITSSGVTLNGTVTADGGAALTDRGFYWKTAPGVTTSDMQLSEGGTTVASFSKTLDSLSVNTVYYYRAYAANSVGTTLDSAEASFFTLANTPNAPTVDTATGSSLNVTIDSGDGNPGNTIYAIQETTTANYVQPNGTLGTTPVYQTTADWGNKTVTGLDGDTTYTFQVQAQNGAGINTAFGSPASESTILAPVVLAGWDMHGLSGGANNFGPSPFSPVAVASGITVDGLTRGSGLSTTGTAAGRAWGGVDWQSTDAASAVAANKFFTFTITPNAGKSMSLTSVSRLDYRRSGTGPSSGVLQCSTNGIDFADITTLDYSVSASTGASLGPIDLTGVSVLQNVPAGETVTFRIVNFGGTSTSGTCYIFDVANSTDNDLEIDGYVSNAGSSPAIPVITSIQISGDHVLIDFTGGASDATTDFSVISADSAAATLAPIASTITTTGPGQFRATLDYSASTPAAFFRIQH